MREAGDIQCKDVTYLEDSRNMTKFILEINRWNSFQKNLKTPAQHFKKTNHLKNSQRRLLYFMICKMKYHLWKKSQLNYFGFPNL